MLESKSAWTSSESLGRIEIDRNDWMMQTVTLNKTATEKKSLTWIRRRGNRHGRREIEEMESEN